MDSECVRRLGLDFTKFARICLQTDTWLRELRVELKAPVLGRRSAEREGGRA